VDETVANPCRERRHEALAGAGLDFAQHLIEVRASDALRFEQRVDFAVGDGSHAGPSV
jgi:hypothetical protein